jgi:hypothetical protein
MPRLRVEAVTREWTSGDAPWTLLLAVSVSRADDGSPVTGLEAMNFRVASTIGPVQDFKISAVYEGNWEPGDTEPAGVYSVDVIMLPVEEFMKGNRYVFGIQVRTFDSGRPPNVVDQGQTIIELISLGV